MKNQMDDELSNWIDLEHGRQKHNLEMIASENYVSPAVLQAQGSILTNKYAEGYPGRRYYGGCQYVDMIEDLARQRACQLFHAEAANVQPHSGSQANMAVYFSALKPGDKILGMDLTHGGHLTHGSPVNFSGKLFHTAFYQVNSATERLDFDEILTIAKREKPQLIVAGASAYPRTIDFKNFQTIAQQVGARLLVDMAHIAGLVAAGLHPSPIGCADWVTTTTHKTLRGPRGGLIFSPHEEMKKINSQIFPGIQGGPLMHVIAAKAACFHEALQPSFKRYIQAVLDNTQALAKSLLEKGYRLISGGSDNHLILVDVSPLGCSGKEAEATLDLAGITVNKNTIPFDKKGPMITSGIRIGLAALTTRGFRESEIKTVANWIDQALRKRADEAALKAIAQEVHEMCKQFPLFQS